MTSLKEACVLKLYVAGNTHQSIRAFNRINHLLEKEFHGAYVVKLIDVSQNPQLAEADDIRATPTLVKTDPPPLLKFIGDFSEPENILLGLGCFSSMSI